VDRLSVIPDDTGDRWESDCSVRSASFVLCSLLALSARGETSSREAVERGDLDLRVALDPGEQAGRATATIRIHASRDVVWTYITTCAEALKTVPGLIACKVLDAAPDGSWQRLQHVLDYSWFIPRLTYEIRATYDRPSRVWIERVSGDIKTLRVEWVLEKDGNDTLARYSVELSPGFWVPQWLVRSALKRDLPRMLRAVRSEAQSAGAAR
jgi:hypothetical protein